MTDPTAHSRRRECAPLFVSATRRPLFATVLLAARVVGVAGRTPSARGNVAHRERRISEGRVHLLSTPMRLSAALVLFALLASAPAEAQLQGYYGVGSGAGATFATPAQAAQALRTQGVSGPVTFFVQPGVYSGRFTIGSVPGANVYTPILFEGSGPTQTTLTDAASGLYDDYIVKLDDAAYVTVRGFRFEPSGPYHARSILIDDSAEHVTIEGCQFQATNLFGAAVPHIVRPSNVSDPVRHLSITDNEFLPHFDNGGFPNSLGIDLTGTPSDPLADVVIRSNTFDRMSYSGPAVRVEQAVGLNITHNTFARSGGIGAVRIGDFLIDSNSIHSDSYAKGLELVNDHSSSAGGLVVNNFVTSMFNDGVHIAGLSGTRIVHNTFVADGIERALVVGEGTTQPTAVELYGNIIRGAGNLNPIAEFESARHLVSSDRNHYSWRNNGTRLAIVNGRTANDLADLQAATRMEANSVEHLFSDPIVFANVTTGDLHLASPSSGDPDLLIPSGTRVDIDGTPRGRPETRVGADEGKTVRSQTTYPPWTTRRLAATDGPVLSAPRPSIAARSTQIAFSLTEAGPARLAVYDVRGREVSVLVDGQASAGTHAATLDARALAPGVYVVRLSAAGEVHAQRLTVVR